MAKVVSGSLYNKMSSFLTMIKRVLEADAHVLDTPETPSCVRVTVRFKSQNCDMVAIFLC